MQAHRGLPYGSNYGKSRNKILDFRGFDSCRILSFRGGLLMSRGFSGKFASSNLSRDNVSREIGRSRRPVEELFVPDLKLLEERGARSIQGECV